jgi:hypothetical protein
VTYAPARSALDLGSARAAAARGGEGGGGGEEGSGEVQKWAKSAQYWQPGEERREKWMKERKGEEQEEENGIEMGGVGGGQGYCKSALR